MRLINLFAIVAVVFLGAVWLLREEPKFCKIYQQEEWFIMVKKIEFNRVHYDIWHGHGKTSRTVHEDNFDLRGWVCIKPPTDED